MNQMLASLFRRLSERPIVSPCCFVRPSYTCRKKYASWSRVSFSRLQNSPAFPRLMLVQYLVLNITPPSPCDEYCRHEHVTTYL